MRMATVRPLARFAKAAPMLTMPMSRLASSEVKQSMPAGSGERMTAGESARVRER